MNNRYKVRMYESGDGDGSIAAGTIVLPVDHGFSVDAASTEDAERKLRKDVVDGKLSGGRVYQISPAIGNSESIRTVAFSNCVNANTQQVAFEPAKGLYSGFKRLRYVEETAGPQEGSLDRETVPA
jgi:hypothetical protein